MMSAYTARRIFPIYIALVRGHEKAVTMAAKLRQQFTAGKKGKGQFL